MATFRNQSTTSLDAYDWNATFYELNGATWDKRREDVIKFFGLA
jgi:hypothetical protein